jgi:AcrR family transcriptional regulator
MPYSIEHKQQSQERILAAAVDLFCRFGFDKISVAQVMKQADMTHGAFYAHFKSKSMLYAQAIKHAAVQSLWTREQHNINQLSDFEYLIERYLSLGHVKQLGPPCPLAFLVTDVAHSEPAVREAYQQTLQSMLNSMTKQLEQLEMNNPRALAQQIMTSMIGAVSVARTLSDEQLQLSILNNAKTVLFNQLKPTNRVGCN